MQDVVNVPALPRMQDVVNILDITHDAGHPISFYKKLVPAEFR